MDGISLSTPVKTFPVDESLFVSLPLVLSAEYAESCQDKKIWDRMKADKLTQCCLQLLLSSFILDFTVKHGSNSK